MTNHKRNLSFIYEGGKKALEYYLPHVKNLEDTNPFTSIANSKDSPIIVSGHAIAIEPWIELWTKLEDILGLMDKNGIRNRSNKMKMNRIIYHPNKMHELYRIICAPQIIRPSNL